MKNSRNFQASLTSTTVSLKLRSLHNRQIIFISFRLNEFSQLFLFASFTKICSKFAENSPQKNPLKSGSKSPNPQPSLHFPRPFPLSCLPNINSRQFTPPNRKIPIDYLIVFYHAVLMKPSESSLD
jgi:hypothetical protein